MVKRNGEVMAKSKGNGVAPDDLVKKEGADAGRVYEMFIGPPAEDSEWSDVAIQGPVRFLHKVWRLAIDPESIERIGDGASSEALRRSTHQAIRRVTEDYASFSFNTAVAALMTLSNALQDHVQGGGELGADWRAAVDTMVVLLHPMAPHITEELWARTGHPGLCADAAWPEYDPAAAAEARVTLVVQVAGKVRDRIDLPTGVGEDAALAAALGSDRVRAHLPGDGRPRKVIYIPDRLINLVP
jgi:leucyl-tRNA synthetase